MDYIHLRYKCIISIYIRAENKRSYTSLLSCSWSCEAQNLSDFKWETGWDNASPTFSLSCPCESTDVLETHDQWNILKGMQS